MFLLHLCYVMIAGIAASASAAGIPSYIHICKRNDPAVSKCILESVEALRPKLKTGMPELDVPALEPLRLDNILVGRSGPASFKIELQNIDIYGLGNFRINKLKLDVPNQTYKISVSFPKLHLVGQYDVDVKVLSLPLKGKGDFDANATKCDGVAILKAEVIDDNGTRRMHFKDLDLNLNIADYRLHLSNLFADRDLTNGLNEIINQNKAEFISVARPYITAKTKEIILTIANNVVKNFAYDEVFPEQ